MLKIRLTRVGKSHTPIYRLVVAEKTRAVKRESLEILGLYNPTNKDNKFQVKKDRVLYWMSLGAQPSDTVRNLLCDFDILPKKDKIKIVHGKKAKKKAVAEDKTEKFASEAEAAQESNEDQPVESQSNSKPEVEVTEQADGEEAVSNSEIVEE